MDKKYTILYIDDNCDNRVLVERFLDFEGFEVYSVETGQQGLEQANRVLPDVFLIDLNLPDMSGYEIVKILNNQTETKDIPKIIFSANDIEPPEKDVGFSYFLPKPLDVTTLPEKIEYAIQHPNGSTGRVL